MIPRTSSRSYRNLSLPLIAGRVADAHGARVADVPTGGRCARGDDRSGQGTVGELEDTVREYGRGTVA